MKVTMKMNCLGREEEWCSSLRALWAPAPAPRPTELVSPSCWAPGHISPQLEDILQQDTGKAIPLVVAVDVATSQEVRLKPDGLFLRMPPDPPTKSPAHSTHPPACHAPSARLRTERISW